MLLDVFEIHQVLVAVFSLCNSIVRLRPGFSLVTAGERVVQELLLDGVVPHLQLQVLSDLPQWSEQLPRPVLTDRNVLFLRIPNRGCLLAELR